MPGSIAGPLRYGIITRAELAELGLTRSGITQRLRSGVLVRKHPGIYRVQAVNESWLQNLYALCRRLEPSVVVSHRAAARIWEIGDVARDLLEVTVAGAPRRIPGVEIHASAEMPRGDRRFRNLIPITSPTRTCIDCCSVLSEKAAQHVIDDACHLRLTTPDRLMQRIDEMSVRGRNGVALARKLMEQRIREAEIPESRLTRMLLRLIQQSPLPNPVSLTPIQLPNGVTIHPDLGYPELMIAIEADGWRDHGRKHGWQGDMHRGNPLQNMGWIVLRFSWEDVTTRPDYVLETIADALRGRGLHI